MKTSRRLPVADEQGLLDGVRVQLLRTKEWPRFSQLLRRRHYLGSLKPVGERLCYVARDAQSQWVALLVFSAPAKHLKDRDRWIGWSSAQRHRRLSLVTNNRRFLLLPERTVPNLGTKVLRLTLDRLSADWQARYGHPVLIVETFVDPDQFCGTVYTAQGWTELGLTEGWGRRRRDYYVKHDRPKRLFVRELCRRARRSLQAERLKPSLAGVEQQVVPRCSQRVGQIRSLVQQFRAVPEFRARVASYPLTSLLTIVLLAMLCEAPRGQKDPAKFARGMSQAQRAALRIRRNRQGRYPAPSQSTFCRLLQQVDGAQAARLLRQIQGHKDEAVARLTSAGPDRLDAAHWLDRNRGHWGIEGLHQRLDVSHNDDRCRVRDDNGMRVLGMMRRLSNSLFMEWRRHQPHPDYLTTTDFHTAMAEDHLRRAMRLVTNRHPSLKPPS